MNSRTPSPQPRPTNDRAGPISIVISFRNEAEVFPELFRRLEAALGSLPNDYEVILVDDDSTDDSLKILAEQARRNPRFKGITMSRRFGHEPCLRAGLEHASGDAVITMDADLQDPPELLPELVGRWRDGADVVITTRTRRLGENPFKMWLTRMAYKIIWLIADVKPPENSGEFRLFGRRALDELLKLKETHPYMRGLVRWIGLRQETIYYERKARAEGTTHFSLLSSLNPYRTFIMALTSFSAAPVYLVMLAGLAATLASLAGLAVIAIAGLNGAAAWPWFVLLLWGSLMFSLGWIGIYVTRIFNEVRGRPPYIIRATIGFDGRSSG